MLTSSQIACPMGYRLLQTLKPGNGHSAQEKIRKTCKIKLMLEERMNAWEERQYCTLVKSV